MNLKILIFTFFLIVAPQESATASSSRANCVPKNIASELKLHEIAARLKTEIKNPLEALSPLILDSGSILGVHKLLGSGAFSAGVFAVETPFGRKALKLYTWGKIEDTALTVLIQRALGDLDLAPKVRGVLSKDQITHVLERFPPLLKPFKKHGTVPSFGIVMDEIPGSMEPHNYLPREHFEGKKWEDSAWAKRINEFEHAMSALRIAPPEDMQLLIDPNDRLLLNDFDLYKWVAEDGIIYDLVSPAMQRHHRELSKRNDRDHSIIEADGTLVVRLNQTREWLEYKWKRKTNSH